MGLVPVVGVVVVIRVSILQNFLTLQPIAVKLWLQIGHNLLDFRTISDY